MSIDDLSWKVLVPVSVILLLIVFTSAYLIFSPSSAQLEHPISEPKIIEVYDNDNVLTGATYTFEPFILNLKNGSGILSLKVTISVFELQLPPYFNTAIPAYRDRIISIVTAYSANELLEREIRDRLQNDLVIQLNEVDKNGPEVVKVYFEEFVVR